jgi:uncharacterized hydrophobic protein (TIGR00341 family)
MEMVLPHRHAEGIEQLLEGRRVHDVWRDALPEGRTAVKALLPAEGAEAVLDLLEERFSHIEGFRIVLLSVEATLPRIGEERKEEPAAGGAAAVEGEPEERRIGRLGREELYSDVRDTVKVSGTYVAMVVLSTVVAAIGLVNDSVAVIIGAMVIAPLLGPNVALSLATTLGDVALARTALRANGLGLAIALALAVLLGLLLPVDPAVPELASRSALGMGDLALALASGAAGALAFTTGLSATLIGVMVAVALLPPLVTCGLMLGSGQWEAAVGALLLTAANVICVNLAGVTTFLVQGVRPATWWEADRAKRATRRALLLWALLLTALVAIVLLSPGG